MLTPSLYPAAIMRRARQRRRTLAVGILAVLVLGIVIPQGVSTQPHALVTGHSTFFNGSEHDPCLAAIVGIMRYKVLWFNDMVLTERYNGDGTYIYITENGTADPTSQFLVSSGIFYDFVDPNGVEWHVQEAYWEKNATATPETGSVTVGGEDGVTTNGETGANVRTERFYTWIVAVDKPHRDNFAGDSPHDFYNFVSLVNTCKFNARNRDNTFLGNVTHEEQNNTVHNGHEKYTGDHDHETYHVGLWVGGPPRILPVGTETPNYVGDRAGFENEGDAAYDPESGTYNPRQPDGNDGVP